ncbi:High mobility group protein isoform 1 [Schistosoma japonicum]|uniref:High mobility group protein isoform 1 n=1 Tax=Schistosoma japonicum TaxID=6182 RepID=A0A4Z2DQB2_SCHJA|nr:High mobility group protein isoform 1 [Schistosoma japonicum]
MNKTKDKNKPKGPMSAYSCFVQVIREEHKKKHPGEQIVFSDFSKKCAERWKLMTPKEKKRFEDLAVLDRERFNREMCDYVPPDGIKKGKKRKGPKDPSVPARAWSAFFFFCDEFRAKVRESNPDWKVADIAKELGRQWESCQDKAKYELLAQKDKQRYEEVNNAFLFRMFFYKIPLFLCILYFYGNVFHFRI